MRKNKGGNIIDTFISKLINDKVSHLYFLSQISELSSEKIKKTKEFVDKGFKECYDYLQQNTKYNIYRNSHKYYDFGYLLGILNNKFNNINYINYGSEGQLLDFIDYQSENYIVNLEKYLKGVKFIQNPDYKKYTLENYLKKIGYDIAIFQYIFTNQNNNYKLSDYFEERFNKQKDDPEFENKLKKELEKILNNKYINNLNLNENIFLELQQYFNFYKYPFKLLNNINYLFNNTTLIYFSDIKFNRTIFVNKLLQNIQFFKDEMEKYFNDLLKQIETTNYDKSSIDLSNLKIKITDNQLDLIIKYIKIKNKLSNGKKIKIDDLAFIKQLKITSKLGYIKQFLSVKLEKLAIQIEREINADIKIEAEKFKLSPKNDKSRQIPQQKTSQLPTKITVELAKADKDLISKISKELEELEQGKVKNIKDINKKPMKFRNKRRNVRFSFRDKKTQIKQDKKQELEVSKQNPDLEQSNISTRIPKEDNIEKIFEDISSLQHEYDLLEPKPDESKIEDLEISKRKTDLELPLSSVQDVESKFRYLKTTNIDPKILLDYSRRLNTFKSSISASDTSSLTIIQAQEFDIKRNLLLTETAVVQKIVFSLFNSTGKKITELAISIPNLQYSDVDELLRQNKENILILKRVFEMIQKMTDLKSDLFQNFTRKQLLLSNETSVEPIIQQSSNNIKSLFDRKINIRDIDLLQIFLSDNRQQQVHSLERASRRLSRVANSSTVSIPFVNFSEILPEFKPSILPEIPEIPEILQEDLVINKSENLEIIKKEVKITYSDLMEFKIKFYYMLLFQEVINARIYIQLENIKHRSKIDDLASQDKQIIDIKHLLNSSSNKLTVQQIRDYIVRNRSSVKQLSPTEIQKLIERNQMRQEYIPSLNKRGESKLINTTSQNTQLILHRSNLPKISLQYQIFGVPFNSKTLLRFTTSKFLKSMR